MALISAQAAVDLIQKNFPLPKTSKIDLENASSRVLAQEVVADRNFPPFDRAMMDGYAVKLDQLYPPYRYNMHQSLFAGEDDRSFCYDNNSLLEIATGAKVPGWADAIVPIEVTRSNTDGIELIEPKEIENGDYIHRQGSDHSAGSVLLKKGTQLGSREIGVLASCGLHEVTVMDWPNVCVIATGDELVDVDQLPAPYQIRRSNDYAVAAAFRRLGIPCRISQPLPDDEVLGREKLMKAMDSAEVILTCGGISKGRRDLLPRWLEESGFRKVFHGVHQKPGKPLGVWIRSGQIVFALPGNPLSVLVSLHRYVLPAFLSAMGGDSNRKRKTVGLHFEKLEASPLTRFLPVQLDPVPCLKLAGNSGDFIRILESDGFIEVPPSEAPVVGDCQFQFFEWN